MAEKIWNLISVKEIKKKYKLEEQSEKNIEIHRKELKKIFSGKDDRKILIIGPCSADFEESLYEYAEFLSDLQMMVWDKIKIVMRFYTGKPRTVWGWKGLQNSIPGKEPNLITGIENSRRIAVNIIQKYNLPLADELLHPQLINYFDDIFSYFAIGARSTENQFHREVASWLEIPVWMKNPTSGDIWTMCNSIKAGQTKSTYAIWEKVYETQGNKLTHWVLRWGSDWPNYSLWDIVKTFDEVKKREIKKPWIIIDCNHSNSWKKWKKQVKIMNEVLDSILKTKELNSFVKWFMIESYLFDWRQDFEDIKTVKKGLSLTDPCVGKNWTVELVESLYERL